MDRNLEGTAGIVNGLVDILDDEEKKKNLLEAWNGFKIEVGFGDILPEHCMFNYPHNSNGTSSLPLHLLEMERSGLGSREDESLTLNSLLQHILPLSPPDKCKIVWRVPPRRLRLSNPLGRLTAFLPCKPQLLHQGTVVSVSHSGTHPGLARLQRDHLPLLRCPEFLRLCQDLVLHGKEGKHLHLCCRGLRSLNCHRQRRQRSRGLP